MRSEVLDMKLIRCKIGDCVELFHETCGIKDLTNHDVSGINKDKEFFEPSRQVGADTSKYKIVPPNYFACNLMHVGRDKLLPISLNHSKKEKYVSPAYIVFKIKENAGLLKEYFFMMIKSEEKDRNFWFHTDSSIRDGMSWSDFCELEFFIPDIKTQKKYANIYKGLTQNQQSYEDSLADLKLVCDLYVEHLKEDFSLEAIGPFIEEKSIKNIDAKVKCIFGVSSDSIFCETRADIKNVTLSSYKIVEKGQFAYNPSRINIGSIALRNDETCAVSPMYTVFEINDKTKVLPEFLMIWFGRSEFKRSTLFYATGSVRDMFDFTVMKEAKIPIPDIHTQQAIVDIYNAYKQRKAINEKLKSQIKDICPILIKGSIEEARAMMEG